MKIEAPAYSLAVDAQNRIIIRVDDGKFMDSQYVYLTVEPRPSGIVEYTTKISSIVVNGLIRDALEVEHKFPETAEEFKRYVTNPVLDDLIQTMQDGSESLGITEDTAPKIILN